jgi:hypothetical protein
MDNWGLISETRAFVGSGERNRDCVKSARNKVGLRGSQCVSPKW